MTTSLQDLRDSVYAILNEAQGSANYPLQLIDQTINQAQRIVCSGGLTDYKTGERLDKGVLPFLLSDQYYSTIKDTTLSDDTTVGATTLDTGTTTDFPSSGYLWVSTDVMQYTGTTSTQFTGVTGVDFAHKGGSVIKPLYALPSDYQESVRVDYNMITLLPFKDSRNLFTDVRNNVPLQYSFQTGYSGSGPQSLTLGYYQQPFYTIIQGQYLLAFNIAASGMMLHLTYNRKPTTMYVPTDTCIVPDEWALETIPYVAVSEIFMIRGEQETGMLLNNSLAVSRTRAMYDYYVNQHAESVFNQFVGTYKDLQINI